MTGTATNDLDPDELQPQRSGSTAISGTDRPGVAALTPAGPRFDSGDRTIFAIGLVVGALTFGTFLGWGPLGRWFTKSPPGASGSANSTDRPRSAKANVKVLGSQISSRETLPPVVAGLAPTVVMAEAPAEPSTPSGEFVLTTPTISLTDPEGQTAETIVLLEPSAPEDPAGHTNAPARTSPTIASEPVSTPAPTPTPTSVATAATVVLSEPPGTNPPIATGATLPVFDVAATPAPTPTAASLDLNPPSNPRVAFPLRRLIIDPPNSSVVVP